MSRIGDVDKMFGKNFSIVTTNAAGNDLLMDENASFITSSMVIASPIDELNNDLGCPTLFVTDVDGQPVRLTYTIKPGNGLVLAYSYTTSEQDYPDVLSLAIDQDTLKVHPDYKCLYVSGTGFTEKSEFLKVSEDNNIDLDVESLVHDNNRVVVSNGFELIDGSVYPKRFITVNTDGIIDNNTIKSTISYDVASKRGFTDTQGYKNQKIYVDPSSLIDHKSIHITKLDNQPVMEVRTDSLTQATSSTPGVVKIDNKTIKTNANSQIEVNTESLKVANGNRPGIVKIGTTKTAHLYNDDLGILRVNTDNLSPATESTKGVVSVDGKTIIASTKGKLKVLAENLDTATEKKAGVVRVDNSTIAVAPNGTINVLTSNLSKGTPNAHGIVKYDNSTIVTNSQGQLSVAKASDWTSAINDLNVKISSLAQNITAMRTEFTNVIALINKNAISPLNMTTVNGQQVSSIFVNVWTKRNVKGKNVEYDTGDYSGSFNIDYNGAYIRFNASQIDSSWINNVRLIVNGHPYSSNENININSTTAICSLKFVVKEHNALSSVRPTVSISLSIYDANGNPLKAITIKITETLIVGDKSEKIVVSFNRESAIPVSMTDVTMSDAAATGAVWTGGTTASPITVKPLINK